MANSKHSSDFDSDSDDTVPEAEARNTYTDSDEKAAKPEPEPMDKWEGKEGTVAATNVLSGSKSDEKKKKKQKREEKPEGEQDLQEKKNGGKRLASSKNHKALPQSLKIGTLPGSTDKMRNRSKELARADREATNRCSEAVACTKFVPKTEFVVDDDGEEPLPIFTRRKLQC